MNGHTAGHSPILDSIKRTLKASLREPTAIRVPDAELLVSSAELLETLRLAGESFRARTNRVDCSFALAGRVQQTELGGLFPRHMDTTLDDYCARLEKSGLGQFTVTLLSCQLHNPTLWGRLRTFIAEVLTLECFDTNSRLDFDCFVGTYDRTPTGIHRDSATNVSYVVDGHKTMLFWPISTFEAFPQGATGHISTDRADYETFEDSAIRVDADAGDMICWPRSYWHIAIENHRTATINFGLYPPVSPRAVPALKKVGGLVTGRYSKYFDMLEDALLRGSRELRLPDGWDQFTSEIESAFGLDGAEVLWEIETEMVRIASKGGFEALPEPRREVEMTADTIVSTSAATGPVWMEASSGKLLVAASGHVLATVSSGLRGPLRLIRYGGRPYSLRELAAAFSGGEPMSTLEAVTTLFGRLYQWYGVELVEP